MRLLDHPFEKAVWNGHDITCAIPLSEQDVFSREALLLLACCVGKWSVVRKVCEKPFIANVNTGISAIGEMLISAPLRLYQPLVLLVTHWLSEE